MQEALLLFLAVVLALAGQQVRAADLVVWWEEEWHSGENGAVRDLVDAFEQHTGKRVELTFLSEEDLRTRIYAALESGRPPDFVFGYEIDDYFPRWAYEGRLTDLSSALGDLSSGFDQSALNLATMFDGTTGRRGLFALPMGFVFNNFHVWRNLLEQAGIALADMPGDWTAFWSFWCDRVQPAVRRATGRDDIYGVGLAMSNLGDDTELQFRQFIEAYGADYVTPDGRLTIDEPAVRINLIKTLDAYTTIYRRGCTPPDSVDWDNPINGLSNNRAFLSKAVVATPNASLSIPNALKATHPEDYYKNAVTIAWPNRVSGEPVAIAGGRNQAAAFRAGEHAATVEEFIRFMIGEGWLAHWLDFSEERILPPMRALLETPFWLDPGDPHRMMAATQYLTRQHTYAYEVVSGEWRHRLVEQERVWPNAVHRVAADGIGPEQAVDEAIARIKQILGK